MQTKVFVNGTFDLLHCGHIELLNYAKSLGDYLLVALDSDARVKELKGPTRPVNSLSTRTCIIGNLKPVDDVMSFDSSEELETIIRGYSPDIMIVGSDWRDKPIVGSQYAKALKFYERTNPASSTDTLNQYLKRISEN